MPVDKRRDPNRAIEPARLASLDALAAAYDATAAAARDYDAALAQILARIQARIATRPEDPAALRRELRRIDASVARHTEDMIEAAQERARIERLRDQNEEAKQELRARVTAAAQARLGTFPARINGLLAELGARFKIDALDIERTAGETRAKFTLQLDDRGEVRRRERARRGPASATCSATAIAARSRSPSSCCRSTNCPTSPRTRSCSTIRCRTRTSAAAPGPRGSRRRWRSGARR